MARGSERPKRLTEVEIHPAAGDKLPALLQVGETAALAVRAVFSDDSTAENVSAAWKSSDTRVLKVSSKGVVTAVGPGTAQVTASVGLVTSTPVPIQVVRPAATGFAATGFAVTDDSGKTVESVTLRIGETKHLNIAVLPSAADQSYTATVSNTSISTVKKGN